METILAINALIQLISTATSALKAADEVSNIIRNAKAEGRDVLPGELAALMAKDDEARAILEQAIRDAQMEP